MIKRRSFMELLTHLLHLFVYVAASSHNKISAEYVKYYHPYQLKDNISRSVHYVLKKVKRWNQRMHQRTETRVFNFLGQTS